jgi:hypothetical protein
MLPSLTARNATIPFRKAMQLPSDSNSAPIYAALLTAAAGVFTTLVTLLVGWAQRKGSESRRLSAIEEAGKRVEFLEAWYRTRVAVTPDDLEESRGLVLRELDAAMRCVKMYDVPVAKPMSAEERKKYVASLSWFRRWFLLYRPAKALTIPARVLFQLVCVWEILTCFAIVSGAYDNPRNYTSGYIKDLLYSVTVWTAVALLMRFFAVFVDRTEPLRFRFLKSANPQKDKQPQKTL